MTIMQNQGISMGGPGAGAGMASNLRRAIRRPAMGRLHKAIRHLIMDNQAAQGTPQAGNAQSTRLRFQRTGEFRPTAIDQRPDPIAAEPHGRHNQPVYHQQSHRRRLLPTAALLRTTPITIPHQAPSAQPTPRMAAVPARPARPIPPTNTDESAVYVSNGGEPDPDRCHDNNHR